MTGKIYHGKAFRSVMFGHQSYAEGMRGAFVPICCIAETISREIILVEKELIENHLELQGFDNFYENSYFYGSPSKYMRELIEKLENYPVQFHDVRLFPPDA